MTRTLRLIGCWDGPATSTEWHIVRPEGVAHYVEKHLRPHPFHADLGPIWPDLTGQPG